MNEQHHRPLVKATLQSDQRVEIACMQYDLPMSNYTFKEIISKTILSIGLKSKHLRDAKTKEVTEALRAHGFEKLDDLIDFPHMRVEILCHLGIEVPNISRSTTSTSWLTLEQARELREHLNVLFERLDNDRQPR